jgi:hypothetical protein
VHTTICYTHGQAPLYSDEAMGPQSPLFD